MPGVKGTEMANFLSRVALGNTLQDVILETTGGGCGVQALNLTNTVFVSIVAPFDFPDLGQLGISNVQMFTKIFKGAGDEVLLVSKDDNRLVIKGRSRVRWLLQEPDLIPTVMEGSDNPVETVMQGIKYKLALPEESKKEVLVKMGLFKPKAVRVVMKSNGNILLDAGLESEHKFDMELGKARAMEGRTREFPSFYVTVYGEHLENVLRVQDLNDKETTLMFGEDGDYPLIVNQDCDTWGMLPVSEDDENTEDLTGTEE